MRSMMLAFLMAFLAVPAVADPNPIGNETPTAEQAQDKAEADTTDEAKEPEPFKVPAGYQARTRGKKVMYCKKSIESGTRFHYEKCYSEEQLRAMSASREEEAVNLDQSRKICATMESCQAK